MIDGVASWYAGCWFVTAMQNGSRGLLVMMSVLVGCGDDGGEAAPDGQPVACPADKPDDATACSLPTDTPQCTYLIQRCECGPSDIEWTCSCGSNGAWSCDRGYDCYPCD